MLGQQVERVRIEHQRRRDAGDQILDQAPRRRVPPEPGPDHPGVGTREAAQDTAQRRVPNDPGRDLRDGADDDLGALLSEDRIDRLRHQEADDACARARCPHARQVGGAGKTLRPRQHHDGAEGALVPIARTGGEPETVRQGAGRQDGLGFGDHRDGDGEVAVVRDAHVDVAPGQRGGRRDPDVRAAVVTGKDLDIAHPRPRDAGRHRLADGFLRGPAARPPFGATAAVVDLSVTEELVEEPIAEPFLGLRNARNRGHIHADPRRHGAYSTVTLFARFRGWSTLQPRSVATK